MTNLLPAVQLIDGHPRVSSLSVSEHFEKRHTDVLRSISNVASECPTEFNERNFASVNYTDEKGESRPMYLLSRDGFTLVAMGFTGKTALAWKVKYIEAFNAMEQALLSGVHGQPATIPLTPSSTADRVPLNNLVQIWVDSAPISKRQAWEMIHAHFNVTSVRDFTVDELSIVMDFVQARIDALPKALPVDEAASTDYDVLLYKMEIEAKRYREAMGEIFRTAHADASKRYMADFTSAKGNLIISAYYALENQFDALEKNIAAMTGNFRMLRHAMHV